MSEHKARFVTEPIVELIGEMQLLPVGVAGMVDWVRSRAPACVPEECVPPNGPIGTRNLMGALFPHDKTDGNGRVLTHNELLVELAGRSCYNSFGLKAGRKSNAEYIAHTQDMDPPHASVLYHAKLSFFIAGVSRRVSHELIRNYVGADRTEEGSPSQQSTRYVENAGFYIIHPRYLDDMHKPERLDFEATCHQNYTAYRNMVAGDIEGHERNHNGERPKGMAYKRILEGASSLLLHSVETSFIWTTNPGALAKLFKERDNEAADLEFQRLARKWKRACMAHAPNLFPQLWMREGL
jgi:thymidylate synthase (FAD)